MLLSVVEDTKRRQNNMTKNYFAVTVKFGHVGKHKFIIKTVAIIAESGKDAAYKARWMARAKHHAKDAILSVKKIDAEAYSALREQVNSDPYFNCKNIQQQRKECAGIEADVVYIDSGVNYEKRKSDRKDKVLFLKKKNKAIIKDCYFMMRNYEVAVSY